MDTNKNDTNMSNTESVIIGPDTPADDISAGLTFMYNLGLDHAIEAVKKLFTDQVQAVVLINALEKLKQ